jgi:NAD(P)H-dependent FMN reductase
MIRIGIILGSTRPNRNGEQVARWVAWSTALAPLRQPATTGA